MINFRNTVNLYYFRKDGTYHGKGSYQTELTNISEIWEDVKKLKESMKLPGMFDTDIKEYHVLIDIPSHKNNVPKMLIAGYNYYSID